MTVHGDTRFWSKVDKRGPDECWDWTAYTDPAGYGRFKVPDGDRTMLAHRYSFILHNGPIHRKWMVLHSCDRPCCVNPRHLRAGDNGDNVRDMVLRDRIRPWGRSVTHCPQGHEYTEGNTYTYRGSRTCRTCRRDRARLERATA